MKPPHFRHLVICEIPGNCPRGDKCFDAHTYAQADRAIKNLHKAFPLKGAAVARFRTELDDAGCTVSHVGGTFLGGSNVEDRHFPAQFPPF